MDGMTAAERRQIEVELLQAMYPDQIRYDLRSGELKYTSSTGGAVTLRLPAMYPEHGLPDLISATDATKNDARTHTKAAIDGMRLLPGEEVLDAIIQLFEEVLIKPDNVHRDSISEEEEAAIMKAIQKGSKTVIVWLHHLLNTNKRKLALNPTINTGTDGGRICGITKPGYPGILIFSGPRNLVEAHVAELKQQRWQAFQIRHEEAHSKDMIWTFEHGSGIKEVETMSEVVQDIFGESNRNTFLKITGVK